MAENILKELCNRLLSLFRQTEAKEENAKEVACNRLRVVLMQDRTNLTPELLQRMRRELVELLSKYVEMDKEALELNFDQDGDQMALMLSIPVIRAKDEAEIEDALKSEEDDDELEDDVEDDEEDSDNSDENAQEDEAEEEEISEDEIEKEDENLSEDENSDKE
ncbi:MAG: cell division topological specificity factor MinE [Candidatus Gastranaerophilaceae bacterium]